MRLQHRLGKADASNTTQRMSCPSAERGAPCRLAYMACWMLALSNNLQRLGKSSLKTSREAPQLRERRRGCGSEAAAAVTTTFPR